MFKEEEATKQIIGIAMEIHRQLGPGFKERVYHNAMLALLQKQKCEVESEKVFKVYLENTKIGDFRVDLLVFSKIIVEIKAIDGFLPQVFRTQLVSYLKASGLEVGLLLNFGNPSLEFKRIAHYQQSV